MTATSTEPMAENVADLETEHLFGHPLPQCPRCGNRHLETVVDDETRDVNFFCGVCDRCWRVELGFAHPIPHGACLRSSKRETPDTPQDGSFSRRNRAQALVALAGGRREPLEQRRAYFQTRLHRASDDYAATEGLRVVEAALRLAPRTDER